MYILDYLPWPIWLLLLFLSLFIIWLFFGRTPQAFIGLKPLEPNTKVENFLKDKIDNTPKLGFLYSFPKRNLSNDSFDLSEKMCTASTESSDDSAPSSFSAINSIISKTPIKIPEKIPEKCTAGKQSAGEKICCNVMEELFKKPFTRIRPNFLKNPETGRNLEIDCYNADLKLGIEYNGIQHYVWPNYTGMSKQEFLNQVRRDQFKVQACDQNGVYLITVPYNVPNNMIKDYITHYLPKHLLAS